MSARTRKSELVIGGSPRVDLLPPEVRLARRGAGARNALTVLLIVSVGAVVAATIFGGSLAVAANANLAAEQAQTNAILKQQEKYIAVRKVTTETAAITAAQRIGTSTEIDWRATIQSIGSALPAGGSLSGATIKSASPVTQLTQATEVLSQPRIATVLLNATSKSLTDAATWIAAVYKVKGVVAVDLTSAQTGPNGYNLTVTVGFDENALVTKPGASK